VVGTMWKATYMHVDYLSISSSAVQCCRHDNQRVSIHKVSYAPLGLAVGRLGYEVEF
jgi:hypothetical protein